MIKRYGKILTSLLTGVLLIGSTIPAFAADIQTSGDAVTGTTPISFSVDVNAVVTIPASLELVEDENGDYSVTGAVSAYGKLQPNSVLTISTADTTVCTNNIDKDIAVVGSVAFGTDGTETWTAEQVANSVDPSNSRDFDVSISKEDIVYAGDYEAIIEFNIEIVKN